MNLKGAGLAPGRYALTGRGSRAADANNYTSEPIAQGVAPWLPDGVGTEECADA